MAPLTEEQIAQIYARVSKPMPPVVTPVIVIDGGPELRELSARHVDVDIRRMRSVAEQLPIMFVVK